MKKSNITKNYMFNVTYQVLIIILPLITVPYVSRIFGADGLGIFSYTVAISSYFIMLGSLGINLYAQKEIAYVHEQENMRTKIFYECIILKIITLSISLFIFYFTFVRLSEYGLYFKILCLEIIANMIDISWFFQGMEEFKKTVSRYILLRFISLICIFIFVKEKEDLYIYFLIYVLSVVIGNLSLWFYLPKQLSEKINIKKINLIKHLKPALILFIPQIAININGVLDKTMIEAMSNNIAEVGYYDQAYKIIRLLYAMITAMGTTMLPRISNYFAKNETIKIKEYIAKSVNFVFFFGMPIMFGIITISDNLVPIFFGNGYEKVSILIKLLSPIIIFIGLSNVFGIQYLLPTKKQNFYTISITTGTIINFLLNLLLIPRFFSIGSEISTNFAELSVLLLQLYFIRNEFNIKNIILKFKNYLFASLLIFIVGYTLTFFIKNNLLCIIVQVIFGVIIYFSVLFILKDKFFLFIINKIIYILKGIRKKLFKIPIEVDNSIVSNLELKTHRRSKRFQTTKHNI